MMKVFERRFDVVLSSDIVAAWQAHFARFGYKLR
jgi:hypothetical protein